MTSERAIENAQAEELTGEDKQRRSGDVSEVTFPLLPLEAITTDDGAQNKA